MSFEHTLSLQQQVARLQALLEASRQIHSTIELDEVLRRALKIVVRELEMKGAFFTGFPFCQGSIPPEFLPADGSSEGANSGARFPLLDRTGKQFTELVVIPQEGAALSLEEADFLTSLAVQTAVAIENARHHEQTVRFHRLEQDLASARAIQQSLLPQRISSPAGYELGWRSISCYEVGGDYLDILPLSPKHFVIVVADVAGKGLASAMVASSFRAAFRAMAASGVPLLDIAEKLNSLHFEEGEEARCRYVTALFLRLDVEAHTMEAVNAGHNPGLLFAETSKDPVLLQASGTPIGMLPRARYRSELHDLRKGARLLAYTDGLTEVFRGDDEFGTERLAETFQACCWKGGDAVLEHIWHTLEEFTSEREPRDDMTAFVLLRS
jgi:serine phosphatase RsbU (regulator of sigma subunit)